MKAPLFFYDEYIDGGWTMWLGYCWARLDMSITLLYNRS